MEVTGQECNNGRQVMYRRKATRRGMPVWPGFRQQYTMWCIAQVKFGAGNRHDVGYVSLALHRRKGDPQRAENQWAQCREQ